MESLLRLPRLLPPGGNMSLLSREEVRGVSEGPIKLAAGEPGRTPDAAAAAAAAKRAEEED
jgi:hypothetical protein